MHNMQIVDIFNEITSIPLKTENKFLGYFSSLISRTKIVTNLSMIKLSMYKNEVVKNRK